jgi:hypothetical protein
VLQDHLSSVGCSLTQIFKGRPLRLRSSPRSARTVVLRSRLIPAFDGIFSFSIPLIFTGKYPAFLLFSRCLVLGCLLDSAHGSFTGGVELTNVSYADLFHHFQASHPSDFHIGHGESVVPGLRLLPLTTRRFTSQTPTQHSRTRLWRKRVFSLNTNPTTTTLS